MIGERIPYEPLPHEGPEGRDELRPENQETHVVAWVRAVGPGAAPRPKILDLYAFTPPRRRTAP